MHTGAWIAWVSLVTAMAMAITNPLYLALLLLCIALVAVVAPRTATGIASFRAMLIFGASMLAISVLVASINGSYGDHVLFTLPGPHIPRWLGGLRLGGPVSGEGIVAAAIRGLAILCVFSAFGVFSGAVSPHRILRSTPAALFHASLVLTVGLTLLPSSVEDLRRIREMRALRGAPGGLRQLPSLVVPAVINGLERSMQLAEAMEARGYAATAQPAASARLAAAASAPLFVAAAWLWFYTDVWKPLGLGLAAVGLGALGWWLWAARRSHAHTSFEAEPLSQAERLGIGVSAGALAALLVLKGLGGGSLSYNPFAGLPEPRFVLWEAALVLLAAWPAVLLFLRPVPTAATEAAPPSATTRVLR